VSITTEPSFKFSTALKRFSEEGVTPRGSPSGKINGRNAAIPMKRKMYLRSICCNWENISDTRFIA
jgi:hypothetical protein